MSDSYRDDAFILVGDYIGDYINEMLGLLSCAQIYLRQEKLGSIWPYDVRDEVLCEAIAIARKSKRVRTIRERFLDPESPHRYTSPKLFNAVEREINKALQRDQRLDELAVILNTTEDLLEFKKAVNETNEIIRGDGKETFPVSSADLRMLIPRVPFESEPALMHVVK